MEIRDTVLRSMRLSFGLVGMTASARRFSVNLRRTRFGTRRQSGLNIPFALYRLDRTHQHCGCLGSDNAIPDGNDLLGPVQYLTVVTD